MSLKTLSLLLLLEFSLLQNHVGAESPLYCFRCLAIDCKSGEERCEDIRAFVLRELRNYYDIGQILPPCPPVDDAVEWRAQEFQEKPCHNAQACSAGRMQIKTFFKDEPPTITHATVLGCANNKLVNSIRSAKAKSMCDMISANSSGTSSTTVHKLMLEHCSQSETLCLNEDFCVRPEQSLIKPFVNSRNSLAKFDYGLAIGIFAFVIVIISAIIGASLCSFPLNKPSNIPKRNEIEDVDLIGVNLAEQSTSASRRHSEI